MAIIRAQAVLQSSTGFARDNCVNTFHFECAATSTQLAGIRDKLLEFYWKPVVNSGSDESVDRFLSTAVTGVQVKLYNVTTEPSGPPLLVSSVQALAATRLGTKNVPEEVALCLSFAGTPTAGLVQSRRRGRVYIGPLRDAAWSTVAGGVTPATQFREVMINAGKRLAVDVDTYAEWVVYSRPFAGRDAIVRPGRPTLPALPPRAGFTVGIDQVSVDDAFDTQRRRGRKATSRVIAATGE